MLHTLLLMTMIAVCVLGVCVAFVLRCGWDFQITKPSTSGRDWSWNSWAKRSKNRRILLGARGSTQVGELDDCKTHNALDARTNRECVCELDFLFAINSGAIGRLIACKCIRLSTQGRSTFRLCVCVTRVIVRGIILCRSVNALCGTIYVYGFSVLSLYVSVCRTLCVKYWALCSVYVKNRRLVAITVAEFLLDHVSDSHVLCARTVFPRSGAS